MKFTAVLSEFNKVLQKVIPAVPPKSTLPILEHLKFELLGNDLRIVATDQDISILATLTVEGEESGSILVPARKLNDIVKAITNEMNVVFTSDNDNYDITLSTTKGKYNMKGLDPDDFLDLPELFESEKPDLEVLSSSGNDKFVCVFEAGVLQRLASKTGFSVSQDEYRPAMTGVFFQFRNGFVNAVATDSFRLVRAKSFSDKYSFEEDFDIILTSRLIDFLKKIDEEVIFSLIESMGKVTHVRIDFGSTILISRIIDERFPPYESVIPTEFTATATIDSVELLKALRRVSIFAQQSSKHIKIIFEDNLCRLSADDEESGFHGDESLECDYSGSRIEIGFNYKNLEEILANIDSSETIGNVVEFLFFEINKPVLIMPKKDIDTMLSLVMPVRLNNQTVA